MVHNSKSDAIPYNPPELLWGQLTYEEEILGCRFEVSPMAFMQGHTEMCERLYTEIIEAAGPAELLLDLCCGIGTIGICLARRVPALKVIGIESVEAACRDAVENSKRNGVTYEVIVGKVEEKLKAVVEEHAGEGRKIVAVLDPPRAGLQKQPIASLRTCRGLDRIVYVACSIESVLDNLAALCGNTRQARGPAFEIEQVTGLDLFPGTSHFETVVVLQRKAD